MCSCVLAFFELFAVTCWPGSANLPMLTEARGTNGEEAMSTAEEYTLSIQEERSDKFILVPKRLLRLPKDCIAIKRVKTLQFSLFSDKVEEASKLVSIPTMRQSGTKQTFVCKPPL
ncbi:unnamed protein product [Protopolystoma xenopodis]|uniref:Uncharacterized protein n=1 Tax=Protopolystoma xenopodis TaxID=117903 RepID=A0A3S5CKI6_9PLAT|nr:unnamed protein product [Protopolystoma xenopodis]